MKEKQFKRNNHIECARILVKYLHTNLCSVKYCSLFLNNIINLYYLLWWIMGAAWKVLFKVLKFHPLATFYVKSSLIIV